MGNNPLNKLIRKTKILLTNPRYVYRKITSHRRVLPNFLVVGAMKAGTTAMHHYLIQHPQILASYRKEIHFFSHFYYLYDLGGLNRYRLHFPKESEMEDGDITGESSPCYLFHPIAPRRIHESLPNVKIIVLLRNPVDRAFSHFNHVKTDRRENLTFDAAIKREKKNYKNWYSKMNNPKYKYYIKDFHVYSYLHRGKYANHLKRWFKYFPKNQIKIIQSERLKIQTQKIMDEVYNFLGVQDFELKKIQKHNVRVYKTQISDKKRDELIEYYKKPNEELFSLIDERFDWNG